MKQSEVGVLVFLLICTIVYISTDTPSKRDTYECCAAINMYDPPCIKFEASGEPTSIEMSFNNARIDVLCKKKGEENDRKK